jgi:hypothetical protein
MTIDLRSLLAIGIASLAALGQAPAPIDLDALLAQADARRREFTETFKSLIAVETRLTELFDKDGRVTKQRLVVSDFLVYVSPISEGVISEYRVPRAVDGKAVRKSQNDTLKTFMRLADAKTAKEEGERLHALLLKDGLKYWTSGYTLHPFGVVAENRRKHAVFTIAGREAVGGRDAVVLAYELKAWRSERGRFYRHFADPRVGGRGRAWLDAADGRLLRWENEYLIVDRDITTPGPYIQTTVEYEPSAFGIWTPREVVATFSDKVREKNTAPSLRRGGRITYTYTAFQRFSVSTTTTIGR